MRGSDYANKMMVIGFLSSHTNKTTFYFILCFHVLYSNVTFFIEHDLSPDEMWQPFTLAIGIPVLNLVIFINKQLKILSDFHCVFWVCAYKKRCV